MGKNNDPKDDDEVQPEQEEEKNPHAVALGALGAAKGGIERSKRLTPEQRTEIAKSGAAARWRKVPQAICGSPDRPLKIGDIEIPCYVLDDGSRVLSQRGLQTGLGMSGSGGTRGSSGEHRMARFVASLALRGIDVKDLTARITVPIVFQPPGGGKTAYGYEATVLPDLCDGRP